MIGCICLFKLSVELVWLSVIASISSLEVQVAAGSSAPAAAVVISAPVAVAVVKN
jgi:hypothetical protein